MRRVLAVIAFVVAALSTAAWRQPGGANVVAVTMIGLLLGSAAMVALRPTWAGLVARGLAWSAVSLGTICVHLFAVDRWAPAASLAASVTSVIAACVGLLLAGPLPRDERALRFRPATLAGPLQLALVLAIADVVVLGLFAVIAIHDRATAVGAFLAVAALATTVAALGLYRLAGWAFLLLTLTNSIIATVMVVDVMNLRDSPLRLVLAVPAIAQLVLAIPVAIAIARGTPIATPRWLAAPLRHARVAVLLAMVALALQPCFGPSLLEWCYRLVLAR
jgi:hypothetical protein